MRKLSRLHQGLNRVRRYRTIARWGSALAVFVAIVLWVLLGIFLLDVATHMGRLERLLLLLIFVGVSVWAFRKYVLPAQKVKEEEVALALMVERQQGIGSDLVAGLQFADDGRAQFGSKELREAVVDGTDKVSGRLNYLEGFSREEMYRRVIILCITVALVLVPVIAYGGHVRAFLNRILLGSAHYPTDTQIVKVEVFSPHGDRAVYGQPVTFKIHGVQRPGAGKLPTSGRAQLESLESGIETSIDLQSDENEPGIYVGKLSRALDDLEYTIYLGDDYTDPATIKLVPLPIVEVDLKIETPKYAAGRFQAGSEIGRQRVALEGSRVVPSVTSDKALESASIWIDEKEYPLEGAGDQFTLKDTKTPLASVTSTLRYEINVVDQDGLSLERPISGTLQVRADQPPRIAAATMTQYVLPTAAPEIKFRAVDDYGLRRIVVHRQVEREETASDTAAQTTVIAEPADHTAVYPTSNDPSTVRLDLSDLDVTKGDRIVVYFEAFDYRGDAPGKSTTSDRIVFQVTDRAGILAAMRQLDTQMDKKLDQIIKAQLGIGD